MNSEDLPTKEDLTVQVDNLVKLVDQAKEECNNDLSLSEEYKELKESFNKTYDSLSQMDKIIELEPEPLGLSLFYLMFISAYMASFIQVQRFIAHCSIKEVSATLPNITTKEELSEIHNQLLRTQNLLGKNNGDSPASWMFDYLKELKKDTIDKLNFVDNLSSQIELQKPLAKNQIKKITNFSNPQRIYLLKELILKEFPWFKALNGERQNKFVASILMLSPDSVKKFNSMGYGANISYYPSSEQIKEIEDFYSKYEED